MPNGTGQEMRIAVLKQVCPNCGRVLERPHTTLFVGDCSECRIRWSVEPRPTRPLDDPQPRVEGEPL